MRTVRLSSDPLQEAKGSMGGYLLSRSDEEIKDSDFYSDIMDQARRQSISATDREVDWYFADERFANLFRKEFSIYPNIRVIYREAIMKMLISFLYHPTTFPIFANFAENIR